MKAAPTAWISLNTISLIAPASPASGVKNIEFIGLIIGGLLAVFNWRYVFLISVPFGVIGTIWAFLKLERCWTD